MKENHHQPTDETQLRVENELKKLNLEMEHGAEFLTMPNSPDLPLEVESEWLDYISAFESQHKNARQTTVFSFIGQPEFKLFDSLKPDEVQEELDHLFDIMEANNIRLSFLTPYPIETVYRFVTEEFFAEPITNMRIPDMNHSFIYEEFHPNHEYDLKTGVEDFFNSIMNLTKDFKGSFLCPVMAEHGNSEMVESVVYEKRIENFRKQFKKLKVNHLEILEIDIQDMNEDSKFAGVVFELDYEGILKGSNEPFQKKGRGYMNFVYEGYWLITRIVFRGFGD